MVALAETDNRHALCRRERQILALLDAGYSRKQVARELHVSISTVQTFIRSAMHKLGADNPIQLGIRYAKSLHESDR